MSIDEIQDTNPAGLYEAAIGETNQDYYLRQFEDFDDKGPGLHASWNWAAFFFTGFWALYRKMYGWFFAWWFFSAVGWVIEKLQDSQIKQVLAIGYMACFLGLTVYANSFYHHKVKKRIAAAQRPNADRSKLIRRLTEGGGVHKWVPIGFGAILAAVIVAAVAEAYRPLELPEFGSGNLGWGIITLLFEYPRVFFLTLIVEALPTAAIAYGLIWLVVRRRFGCPRSRSFWEHVGGVMATVVGAAFFRIITLADGGGSRVFAPSETVEMAFFLFIIPVFCALAYFWLFVSGGSDEGWGAAQERLQRVDIADAVPPAMPTTKPPDSLPAYGFDDLPFVRLGGPICLGLTLSGPLVLLLVLVLSESIPFEKPFAILGVVAWVGVFGYFTYWFYYKANPHFGNVRLFLTMSIFLGFGALMTYKESDGWSWTGFGFGLTLGSLFFLIAGWAAYKKAKKKFIWPPQRW